MWAFYNHISTVLKPSQVAPFAMLVALGCSSRPDVPADKIDGRSFVVRGALVFDGETVLETGTDVVVRNGVIAEIGASVSAHGLPVVDGRGRTLLPGLIDSHTHPKSVDGLAQAMAFGVTTIIALTGDPAWHASARAQFRADLHPAVVMAGWAVTTPGGLASENPEAALLGPADDAAAFVDARVAEGSELIEIMYDTGTAWGGAAPTISREQLRESIEAARAAGKLSVINVATHDEAADALAAGVDGFAHLYVEGSNRELATSIARSGAFVVATLPVLFSVCEGTRGAELVADTTLSSRLLRDERLALANSYNLGNAGIRCRDLIEATRELHELGVPLVAGSDAPSPGTTYGASLLDGLTLLARSGLTPLEALASATSAAATAFRLEGRGRIAPGYRADLVLVDGDPTSRLGDIRRTRMVWKEGRRFDAPAFAKLVASSAPSSVPDIELGAIGEFDDEASDGWLARSDRIRGGDSRATLEVVGGALEIRGAVTGADGWAGALRFLGSDPPQPVSLQGARALNLRVRGDGNTYRIRLFGPDGGRPAVVVAEFVAPETWTDIVVALESPTDEPLIAVALVVDCATPGARFQLSVDRVELR